MSWLAILSVVSVTSAATAPSNRASPSTSTSARSLPANLRYPAPPAAGAAEPRGLVRVAKVRVVRSGLLGEFGPDCAAFGDTRPGLGADESEFPPRREGSRVRAREASRELGLLEASPGSPVCRRHCSAWLIRLAPSPAYLARGVFDVSGCAVA